VSNGEQGKLALRLNRYRTRHVPTIAFLLIALTTGGCVRQESDRPTFEEDLEGEKNASLADLSSVLVGSVSSTGASVTVQASNLGPNDASLVSTRVTASGGTFGPMPPGCVSVEPNVAVCTYNVEYEVLEHTSTIAATLPIVPSPGVPVVTVTATTLFGDEVTYNDPNHTNDTKTVKLPIQ
jgi:hypothetical protein